MCRLLSSIAFFLILPAAAEALADQPADLPVENKDSFGVLIGLDFGQLVLRVYNWDDVWDGPSMTKDFLPIGISLGLYRTFSQRRFQLSLTYTARLIPNPDDYHGYGRNAPFINELKFDFRVQGRGPGFILYFATGPILQFVQWWGPVPSTNANGEEVTNQDVFSVLFLNGRGRLRLSRKRLDLAGRGDRPLWHWILG